IVIEAGAEEDYQLSEVMIGESDRLADMLRTGSVTVTVEGELSISVRARKIRATATLTFDPAQVGINLANGDKVETNKEIEIKITAKDGFRLVSATAGDQIIPLAEDRLSATGKITVTDNFTLTVKSEPIPTYKVEWTEAENCKIEVSGAENGSSVREGKSIHIKVTPAEGFKLTAVTVNGTPRTIADDQLFDTDIIVTADIMIAAEASALPLPVFAITCTQPEHGRIEVKGADDQAAITQGTAVTIAVTADEGYEIQQVAIDDVAQQGDGASTMEIPVTVTGAHTVSAVIVPRQYPVVWESAEGATVSVKSGGKTLKSGDKAEFGSKLAITVTSDANHRLGVVKINGEIADLTNSNSFTQELNVEGPCTIQVWTTVSDKYPVVWSAGDNGSVEVKLADGTDIENGARVVDGAQIEVTVKPYDACKIRSVNVNNVAQQITDETKPLVIKLTVDKPIVISALFYRDTYHLTVKTDDPLNGEVNVEILRDEASPQSDYAGDVKGGKRVRLTAVTYPGCSFGGWTQNGASIAGSAVMTTTIEEASSFVARFRLNTYRQHSVKFLSTDEAHGSIRLLQLDGIALDMAIRSEHIFTTTRRLMVEATPTHPDAIFEGWTDEKGNPISADRRIIYAQNDNVILKANFAMTYAVTAGKTEHGRIILTDAEGYTFDPGEKIKAQKIRITLAPDKGFMPDTLTVNGKGYAQTDMTAAADGSAYVEVALDKATAITAGFAAGTLGAEVIEAETQKGIYYDLNGRRLGAERPSRPGIYILMTGRKSQKIKIM
ncbi:MAG: hypothetical protein J6C91_06260, partial [Muribaculaceae bacterium]|nr:hypothetical protein [Muribaculaceae bacterium]